MLCYPSRRVGRNINPLKRKITESRFDAIEPHENIGLAFHHYPNQIEQVYRTGGIGKGAPFEKKPDAGVGRMCFSIQKK